ncbi:MAG: putative signal transduction histidine kinase [Ferruginibacter sp.]|uniref:PAS domain-containing protein n=1 Tax=Ferruginibacter sp. TaxID=1940288 RepID=UPI0026596D68|nr:PAS domain-containing protein [Ferruginibacter sp.]MDB5280798.1 putative signal transduction histidine kinase [Ferruginibacter sp.]
MKTVIKILIAEHDKSDLEMVDTELKKGDIDFVSQIVQNESNYRKALKSFIPDIILADYTFPSFDGPTAFKIREKQAPGTPFIFVSGTIGEEKSIELIKMGVTDYVLKDKLFTLNPKVLRALKEAEDLHQKKAATQQLVLSEARLARAQELAHVGNWELDFASNMIRCSEELCRIFGLPPGQNVQSQESRSAFVHPEDAVFVNKKIQESRDLLCDLSIHYRIAHANGSIRHIYSEGKHELDSKGQSTGMYGIVHDVTQKVLLENKLLQERQTKQSEITAALLTAQEKERAAIGNELHENLNQILSVAKLYIDLAKTDEVQREMCLKKSSDYIVNVITGIRKISSTLASPGTQFGLFHSINKLLGDVGMASPTKIQFTPNGINEAYLDEKLQLAIFRIVQEQVNNIFNMLLPPLHVSG